MIQHKPASSIPDDKRRIAMIVGPGNGDVLLATALFECIKVKHPTRLLDIHATCGIDLLKHNPFIAEAIKIEAPDHKANAYFLRTYIEELRQSGYYHEIIEPAMYFHINVRHVCHKPRAHLSYLGYNVPSDRRPILYHTATEREIANQFLAKHQGHPKFLIERFCYSAQSCFNAEWYDWLTDYLLIHYPKCIIYVGASPSEPDIQTSDQIVSLKSFTLRQMPLIFNGCDVFFSIHSGISHACTSIAAKSNIIWIETAARPFLGSGLYGTTNKTIHYGKKLNDYIAVVKQRLNKESHLLL